MPKELEQYRRKRDFSRTGEPPGDSGDRKRPTRRRLKYVVQKHAARRLHYDFRLEMEGVLKSWAVPKGPSLDPAQKRLAMHVEDHPLEYGGFEGIIPKGEYGGGTVLLWDRGTWIPEGDPSASYRKGKLDFRLDGKKLSGSWTLVRMRAREPKDEDRTWLLIKRDDEAARRGAGDVLLEERPESVLTGRSLDAIARDPKRRWSSRGAEPYGATADRSLAGDRARGGATSRASGASARKSAPAAANPGAIPGAHRAAAKSLPVPQLATLVKTVPEGEEWLHEMKLDGYRMLARFQRGRVSMISRNHQDWSARFPSLASRLERWGVKDALLDGEVVAFDKQGLSDFQRLQNSLRDGSEAELVYYVFDILRYEGWDLTGAPLEARKTFLKALCESRHEAEGRIRYSDHVVGKGKEFFAEACRFGLEGVVSKLRGAPYAGGRRREWLKTKCLRGQELVIGGYTDPRGSRSGLGSLLLGYHEPDGSLVYAGKVGTGFTHRSLEELRLRLRKLGRPAAPFRNPPRGGAVHWVEPLLVAEVVFLSWTRDGLLRHPTFRGLREDKSPREVVREVPGSAGEASRPEAGTVATGTRSGKSEAAVSGPDRETSIAGVRISHPERVLYDEPRLTKADVARYFDSIAARMLPHVADRPLMLLRCPQGSGKPCFFQKHPGTSLPEPIRQVMVPEAKGPAAYSSVDSAAGLVSLVQMGALEIHTWGSRERTLEKPDVMIFDLDPHESVPWRRVVEAAGEVRDVLAALDLASFIMTTGGKGLHVRVPLRPRAGWAEVKEFSRAVASSLVRAHPAAYTLTLAKTARDGRILIDYLRNGRGATAIAPYSTRARPGAPVAVPLSWKDLPAVPSGAHYTVMNLAERLRSRKVEPWSAFFDAPQSLTAAMKRALGLG